MSKFLFCLAILLCGCTKEPKSYFGLNPFPPKFYDNLLGQYDATCFQLIPTKDSIGNTYIQKLFSDSLIIKAYRKPYENEGNLIYFENLGFNNLSCKVEADSNFNGEQSSQQISVNLTGEFRGSDSLIIYLNYGHLGRVFYEYDCRKLN